MRLTLDYLVTNSIQTIHSKSSKIWDRCSLIAMQYSSDKVHTYVCRMLQLVQFWNWRAAKRKPIKSIVLWLEWNYNKNFHISKSLRASWNWTLKIFTAFLFERQKSSRHIRYSMSLLYCMVYQLWKKLWIYYHKKVTAFESNFYAWKPMAVCHHEILIIDSYFQFWKAAISR